MRMTSQVTVIIGLHVQVAETEGHDARPRKYEVSHTHGEGNAARLKTGEFPVEMHS